MSAADRRVGSVLVVVILLAAAGGWWWFTQSDEEPGTSTGREARRATIGDEEGKAEQEKQAFVTDPYSGETAKEPEGQGPDVAPFKVRILLPGKKPAVGAKVSVYEGAGGLKLFSRFELDALPGGKPRLELVADERGEVDIGSAGAGGRILVGRLGEYAGVGNMTVHEPGSEAAKQAAAWRGQGKLPWINLGAARVIEVVARRADGTGVARVPVTVLPTEKGRMAPSMFGGPRGNADELGTTPTDEDGRARFLVTRQGDQGLFDAPRVRGLAVLHGRKWIDATAPFEGPRAEVVIALPDLLELEFRVPRPEAEKHAVTVAWCQGEKASWAEYMHVNWAGREYLGGEGSLGYLTASWATRFLGVSRREGGFSPGERMSFRVSLWGHEDRDFTQTLPTHSGTHVVELGVGRALPRVTMRLVDEAGRPQKVETFAVRRLFDNGFGRWIGPQPGEEVGGLSVHVPIETALKLEVHARQGAGFGGRSRATPLATLDVPALDEGASRDLGDVVVSAIPVLLSGRVVDSEGQGISGAHVSAVGRETSGPMTFRADFSRASATSGEDGRFEIRAKPNLSWGYTAEVTGLHRSEKVSFEPGTKDFVIEASAAGSLQGRLVLADPAMFAATKVELVAPHLKFPKHVMLQDGGWFEGQLLRPATYELVVRIGGKFEGFVARRVPGIVVKSGEPTKPEALQALRVGDDFVRGEVAVLGPDDRPYAGASVTWEGKDGDDRITTMEDTGASGRVSVWVRSDVEITVSVSPAGSIWGEKKEGERGLMRPVIKKARFPLTARLRHYPRLALKLEPGLPQVAGVAKWRVSLGRPRSAERIREIGAHRKKSRYPDRPVMPFSVIQHADAAPGDQDLTFDEPGFGDLCLILWSPDGHSGILLGRFHFPEGAGDTTLPLALDAAALEEVKGWAR